MTVWTGQNIEKTVRHRAWFILHERDQIENVQSPTGIYFKKNENNLTIFLVKS